MYAADEDSAIVGQDVIEVLVATLWVDYQLYNFHPISKLVRLRDLWLHRTAPKEGLRFIHPQTARITLTSAV